LLFVFERKFSAFRKLFTWDRHGGTYLSVIPTTWEEEM
jgi:hypothetical protein